jgi:hypothetical protein
VEYKINLAVERMASQLSMITRQFTRVKSRYTHLKKYVHELEQADQEHRSLITRAVGEETSKERLIDSMQADLARAKDKISTLEFELS